MFTELCWPIPPADGVRCATRPLQCLASTGGMVLILGWSHTSVPVALSA